MTRRRILPLALLPALLAALPGAGCIDALDPEVGAPLVPLCVDEDSAPGRKTSFRSDVLPLLFRECGCHRPDGPSPIGLAATGLDLSSYQGLRAGGARSGPDAIVPGRPCASIVVGKVSGAPPFGARMPLTGAPLTAAEQQLLRDWIAEGALDD